jgi:hypothetical protein
VILVAYAGDPFAEDGWRQIPTRGLVLDRTLDGDRLYYDGGGEVPPPWKVVGRDGGEAVCLRASSLGVEQRPPSVRPSPRINSVHLPPTLTWYVRDLGRDPQDLLDWWLCSITGPAEDWGEAAWTASDLVRPHAA